MVTRVWGGARNGKGGGGVGGTNHWVLRQAKDILYHRGIQPIVCNSCKWTVTFKKEKYDNNRL